MNGMNGIHKWNDWTEWNECMNAWMDGRRDGWMDERMNA